MTKKQENNIYLLFCADWNGRRKRMTLGEKIKKYRELRGLTQKALGERVGFYLEEKYGLEITKTRDEILLTFDSNNTAIWKLMVYLELWAAKKEEYTRNKGNATGEFEWKVYEKCNGKKELKAGFVKEIEAREYASFLESCNRVAGYNESKFRVEYVPLVSEVQDEYDIWKAQFPKNLERAEIQHAQK